MDEFNWFVKFSFRSINRTKIQFISMEIFVNLFATVSSKESEHNEMKGVPHEG
jgi:hypothetical protein